MFHLITCCSPHTFKRPILPQISLIYSDKQQNSLNLKQTVFLCDIMQLCCIPLCHLRNLRENTHPNLLNLYCSNETPEVSRRSRWFTQTNHKTALTSPICLSLRDNAACCIPLRDLRNLRENTHPNLLNQYTQTKPQCPPQISQITQTKPTKQQNNINLNQTVFLCVIMQPAAFVCVICAICGRIFT